MEKERAYKAHVVVLPFHGQGHLNTMIQFSKRLASKGIKITVTSTLSSSKKMQAAAAGGGSITFESIYDDCTESEISGGVGGGAGLMGHLEKFEASGSRNLLQLIISKSDFPVKCLVYDANIVWALDIAKQLGIAAAAFFTQSCAAIASYYPMLYQLTGEPLPLPAFSMPGLPHLRIPDLPSSIASETGCFHPLMRYILKQFNNIEKADWVLFNSFDTLEEKVVKWMSNLWPVRTIGPTLPSVYLDNRVENDSDYGFNLYKPNSDTCIEWLNTKPTGSVVYVSFGSAASLNAQQMTEMAEALRQNSDSFLWVVRPTEHCKLPSNFVEETSSSEKGLVVPWCSQLQVLSHHAVGCFITHCGWNSTIEGISFGVPLVAMPQFLDQITNAYFAEKFWEVGIKPEATDENGFTTRTEINRCITEIMHGERGHLIKKNAIRWRELAMEAVSERGSSDKYIDEIIASLVPN